MSDTTAMRMGPLATTNGGETIARARPRGRTGRGLERGCRRLPGQAIRDGRAPRARGGAIARLSARKPQQRYRFGAIEVDLRAAEVQGGGVPVPVSAKEFGLLRYFIRRRGVAIPRDELLDEVWGLDAMPTPRTVDVHASWLRRKLEADPRNPRVIVTVRGRGYKFVA